MIKRFDMVAGQSVEKIYGQERYGYAHSDSLDFYDLVELAKQGVCPGNELYIYDYQTGKVNQPFEKRKNVVYGDAAFAAPYIYVLQGDYDRNQLNLYRYLPGAQPEKVTELNFANLNPYNLQIVGNPLYVISQDGDEGLFRCYYPTAFSFPLQGNESVMFIEEGKVYLEAWVEEGWDSENNCATEDYRYYSRVIVKDFEGNVLSEELGCLTRGPDGNWWIS